MSEHVRVNPILCDAHGHCAELFPELISLDEWGYPIVSDEPIPPDLAKDARRAVSMCPRLALAIERRSDPDAYSIRARSHRLSHGTVTETWPCRASARRTFPLHTGE